jgi:hypothetical protein
MQHYIVCIIKVKREHESEGTAINQMVLYMKNAVSHLSQEDLHGYLIMGSRIILFLMTDEDVKEGISESFDSFTAGEQFTTELSEIALRTWNT